MDDDGLIGEGAIAFDGAALAGEGVTELLTVEAGLAGASPSSLENALSDPGHGIKAPVLGLIMSLHCGFASRRASILAVEHAVKIKGALTSKKKVFIKLMFIGLF